MSLLGPMVIRCLAWLSLAAAPGEELPAEVSATSAETPATVAMPADHPDWWNKVPRPAPAVRPGFDFSHGLPPSRQRRLSASCDYLRSFTARHRPLAPAPLSHGACTRSSKPRAIATPCPPEPRHHAVKLRHGFVAPATAVPSNPPRFATAQASRKPGSPACGLQGLLSGVPESPPPLRPVFIFR